MKSTKRRARTVPPPLAPDDPFEMLRDAFLVRLRSDRGRLTALSAALACAEGDPGCIFEELRQLAHRLRGAAAIFEAHEVGRAADALEQAACSASVAHADSPDTSLWAALEGLIDRLASNSDSSPTPDTESTVSRRTDACERMPRR